MGQDIDESPEDSNEDTEKRVEALEALTHRLVRERNGNTIQGASRPTPSYIRKAQSFTQVRTAPVPSLSRSPSGCESKQQRSRTLSDYLYSVLPRPEIAFLITTRGKSPFTALQNDGAGEVLGLTTHPVLLACKLIHLALCLRHLVVNDAEEQDLQLVKPAVETAQSYVDAAFHVTSQDFLMKSVEGLETLKLQAVYQIILGAVHSAWQTFRRGVGLGYVAGLAKLKDGRSESTWFRAVYSERFASLAFGLQCTKVDDEYASDDILAKSGCTERINRIHVMIAGRIMKRNDRVLKLMQPDAANSDDDEAHKIYGETKDIDQQLKQAAKAVDFSWWAVPDLINTKEGTGETEKMTAQVHQNYLILLLHQPYLHTEPSVLESIDYRHYSELRCVLRSGICDFDIPFCISSSPLAIPPFPKLQAHPDILQRLGSQSISCFTHTSLNSPRLAPARARECSRTPTLV